MSLQNQLNVTLPSTEPKKQMALQLSVKMNYHQRALKITLNIKLQKKQLVEQPIKLLSRRGNSYGSCDASVQVFRNGSVYRFQCLPYKYRIHGLSMTLILRGYYCLIMGKLLVNKSLLLELKTLMVRNPISKKYCNLESFQ